MSTRATLRCAGLALVSASAVAASPSSTTEITLQPSDLTHADILFLAANSWGVHASVVAELRESDGFTLSDLDCSFLDGLKADPFRYMRFSKFCSMATAGSEATQRYVRTVDKESGDTLNVQPQSSSSSSAAAGGGGGGGGEKGALPRRQLDELTDPDLFSGLRIQRDLASISLGADSDVQIYRADTSQLNIGATVLIEQDLHLNGGLVANGAPVDLDALAALNATSSSSTDAEVVSSLPDTCVGRVFVENIGLFECVNGQWLQLYDASCDDNPHTLESHILYNGGGEAGFDEDSGMADGWEEYCCGDYNGEVTQGQVTTEWQQCGRHAFHWKSTEKSVWDLIEQTREYRFQMLAGCLYSVSFWAYCTDLGRDLEYPGHFRTELLKYDESAGSYLNTLDTVEDSDSTFREYHYVGVSEEGKWTYFEHSGIEPLEDTWGVSLNFGMVEGWSGECFVDHLQVYSTTCEVEANYICGGEEESVDHPDQGNLIFNGGFEILEENDHVQVTPGSDYAAGFTRYSSYGDTGLLTTDEAHCGSYAVKFETSSSSEYWDLIENDEEHPIDLVAGCVYELSFCALAESGSGNIRTEFLYREDGSQYGLGTTDDSDATYVVYHEFGEDLGVWECFTHTFTPSEDQLTILNFGMQDGWTGTFYIDDLKLSSTTCEDLAPAWRDCEDPEGNFMPDGHFEDDSVGSSPSAYEAYYSPNGATYTVSDDYAYCGDNSVKFTSSSSLGWDLMMNNECVAFTAGETYLFTFWWYAATVSEGESGSLLPQQIRSELLAYSSTSSTSYDYTMPTADTSESTFAKYHTLSTGYEWQYSEHRFTPSGDEGCIKINFGMVDGWQGTYYMDELQLVCETC